MRLLKIGQRIVNLDRVTYVQDSAAGQRPGGRVKGKGKATQGGIRVTFEKDHSLDFTEQEAEDLLRFLDAHVFVPPPGPVEPVEPGA